VQREEIWCLHLHRRKKGTDSARSETFRILQTKTTQINRVLSFSNKKQLKLIVFCSARGERVCNLATKASQTVISAKWSNYSKHSRIGQVFTAKEEGIMHSRPKEIGQN
jgi:hypothetical protein